MSGVTHWLKCWPEYFQAIKSGAKTWEVRKDDRGFEEGDLLILQEFDPEAQTYTGNEYLVSVTYLAELDPFCPGYVGMTIKPA